MVTSHDAGRWRVPGAAIALLIGLIAAWARAAGEEPSPSRPSRPKIRLDVADSARLEVKAFWEPVNESMDHFAKDWDELRVLRPARSMATYSGADFRALWPSGPLAEGQVWEPGHAALLK